MNRLPRPARCGGVRNDRSGVNDSMSGRHGERDGQILPSCSCPTKYSMCQVGYRWAAPLLCGTVPRWQPGTGGSAHPTGTSHGDRLLRGIRMPRPATGRRHGTCRSTGTGLPAARQEMNRCGRRMDFWRRAAARRPGRARCRAVCPDRQTAGRIPPRRGSFGIAVEGCPGRALPRSWPRRHTASGAARRP